MIAECPHCKKVISVKIAGSTLCPKCSSLIFIGDPMKDEESKVIKTAAELNRNKKIQETPSKPDEEEKRHETESDESIPPFFSRKKPVREGFFKGTAWDRWTEIGFSEALLKTTADIFRTPTKFFRDMKHTINPGMIPIYGIVMAFLTVLFQTFWTLKIFHTFFPDFQTFKLSIAKLANINPALVFEEDKLRTIFNAMYPDTVMLFMQLLMTPFMMIVITAIILHLGSVMFGSVARLHVFYRMSGFIMVTGILSIIPVIGNIAGFIWKVVLVYKGGRAVNNFNRKKAVAFSGFFIIMSIIFTSVGLI
ncbi:MAG TPA: Yip1 family protein [bacterium]|nr:Yip1 family protein [bacterium]